jgi:cytoskeletal protein RodZ
MPLSKQNVACYMLMIIAVAFVLLGSSAFVFALSLQQPSIHNYNKVFDKEQDSVSTGDGSRRSSSSNSHSSNSHTKSYDNSNEGNSDDNNKNDNQGTNDGSNTGAHNNNLLAVEPAKSGEQQQQSDRENVASTTGTTTPTPIPHASCEQGSNCTDQQGLNDQDRSSSSSEQDNNNNTTPFVLSLPFP